MSMKSGRWLIAAGTADGRELCERLALQGHILLATVAEPAGASALFQPGQSIEIAVGRRDAAGFVVLINQFQPDAVIDCTHPYACQVTAELAQACKVTGTPNWRLARPDTSLPDTGSQPDRPWIYHVPDVHAAADLAAVLEGPILLTTGSKDLAIFAARIPDFRQRVFARVLPAAFSLAACQTVDLLPDHIIAQQGPFSYELNLAWLRQFKIKIMISKDGGAPSGLDTKLEAARTAGVVTILIDRPEAVGSIQPDRTFTSVAAVLAACGCEPASVTIPRILLAGTGSGCGKTTLTAALLSALTLQGQTIQPFKTGPDYIDPMFHRAATGLASANLDSWLLTPDTIRRLFIRRTLANQADLALIEGVMGLYDGLDDTLAGSTAEVADILSAPIVLLVDGRGLALSICAVINGYQQFRPALGKHIAGVILNRVSPSGFTYLQKLIEKHCSIPVFGYMPEMNACQLGSRHLGLIPACEDAELEQKLYKLGLQASQTIDLSRMLQVARSAGSLPDDCQSVHMPDNWSRESFGLRFASGSVDFPGQASKRNFHCRIGIARDLAFNFYYADNLDLLQQLGAELVYFSPLKQARLPADLDGLYFGGGYPEVYAAELQANAGLRQQIREMVLSGLPTIAECGGFIYLGESLRDLDGQQYDMCGVVPAAMEMTGRLQRFGYQTITLQKAGLLGQRGDQVRAHEFHYSTSSDYGMDCTSAKPSGRQWPSVFHSETAWIGYPHLHFFSQPNMVMNWLNQCQAWKQKRTGADAGQPRQ